MPWKTRLGSAVATTAAALVMAGCGANGDAGTQAAQAGATAQVSGGGAGTAPTTSASRSASPASSPSPSPSPTHTVDPGTLPQTQVLPGDQDPQFTAGAQALWQAIVQDKPALAQSFFFPLSAYIQVKGISDPSEDYQDRLMAWYDLDIQAAHDYLGANASSARFVSMSVPEDQAEWILPGVEYNKGSYYRVYGTRLNYQVNGHDASIGVFSLISWRGEWYVVHLGPSTRPSMEGLVYDAEG